MNLQELFDKHENYFTDKWENYLYIYDIELKKFCDKNEPVNVLEIGVANGGSLELWKNYFPEKSKIIGVDINPNCKNIKYEPPIELYIGDSKDKVTMDKFCQNMQFDVIIDDGSHICPDTIGNFYNLFPRLKDGGVYIVEDVIASYGKYWKGGFRKKNSTVEFFKGLVEAINYDHVMKNPPLFFDEKLKSFLLDYNKQISSITFYDSIIIIKKYNKKKQKQFRQVGRGKVFPVAKFEISQESRKPLDFDDNLYI